MPVNVTYPGLYIEEQPSSAHTITPAPTSITVFIGYVHPFQGECAAGNDWGKPFRIFNFEDYKRYFGELYRNAIIGRSEVGYAVSQFFLNGGSDAYVVGLRPQHFRVGADEASLLQPATGSLGGVAFTARELTDADHKITITIRNLVRRAVANDTADILITCGSVVENYRGVRLRSGPRATYTDPAVTASYDKDFIDNRLKASRLVEVAPDLRAAEYTAAYSAIGSQPLELIDLQPAPWAATSYRAKEFVEAFRADGLLDKVEIFNLLVVPAVADALVWNTGLHFCEHKRAMFIMDPPEDASADGMDGLPLIQDIVEADVFPKSSANGALYFPYLKAPDPSTGETLHLPPSGYIAGIYARTDTNRGVWKAPAGLETTIVNTTGVVDEGKMTDLRQGTLNPLGVNVVRSFPGAGTVVWGARTIVTKNPSFEQWRYVPVRRMALFLEQTLLRNLGWVVFEPNDEPLWAAIRLSIESFMLSLFRQSAFQGRTPSEAFLVKCDKVTTTEEDIKLGKVNIVVGFRPLKPAEFVIIKISQLAGQVQA
jgi:hypothetical protein